MAGIILIRDGEHDWREAAPEWRARRREGDPGLVYKSLMASAPGRANMQRTRYHPHHHEAPHSHPEDEIIFVLDGVVAFGRDELRYGDAIFVPQGTVYSLHTGETGAEFLRIGFSDLAAPPKLMPATGEQP